MASDLNPKLGAFDMVSRVGRQIDEKLNAREVFEKFLRPARRARAPPETKERRLLPPQQLIELLDRQETEEPSQPKLRSAREKHDENFLFRKQSRHEFYHSTVKARQHKGDPPPPVGYYDPNFATVERASLSSVWSRSARVSQKAVSLNEGSMKLNSEQRFPVKPTIHFAKQLPRKDVAWRGTTCHSATSHSLLTRERVSGPDMSKTLGRVLVFPGSAQINPDYRPDYSRIWKPVARNLFFAKTQGRVDAKINVNDLDYEKISYSQVKPKINSPSFQRQVSRPDSDSSPLPLFMRNLSSWLSASSANEKILQMRTSLDLRPQLSRQKVGKSQSVFLQPSSCPLTKRSYTEKAATARIRSSSLASLN